MLKNIKQTDNELSPVIQESGCLFLCFAQVSPLIFEGSNGRKALNKIWKEAVKKGYISKEDIILKHNEIANEFFALDVKYDDIHHKADETIPDNVKIIFGHYIYKYGHFVLLNKNKEVIFDSFGVSNTVKNGQLETMRWYFSN